ncbi:MAG: carbohydrate kinase [Erysipelotrichaceae bacterium]|nr:carbohydrate kinase [Erysipelotrichaceae bacterium]
MKRYDVTALGELLIDFINVEDSSFGNPQFEANPGGAPCNVLAMLQKLGRKTAFIGKVGKDGFGRQLKEAVASCGVELKGLREDEEVHTTLAFVHKLPDGDRDFSFYRSPGADMMLKEEEVDGELIRESEVLHFGSLSLTDEPVRSATRKALRIAEENGILRSYDPNLRPPLWKSEEEAKEEILWGLQHCDILKIADNEILWLSGKEDYDEGIAWLKERCSARLIALTLGAEGSLLVYGGESVAVAPYRQEHITDTTGAGDTFCACLLNGVLEYGLDELDAAKLQEIGRFASAASSLITQRKGALKSMPEKEEVLHFMEERK